MNQRTAGERVFSFFNTVILTGIALICLYPMLYVVFASFSEPTQLSQHSGLLFSSLGFTGKGYELVFRNRDIATGYLNTLFYVTA